VIPKLNLVSALAALVFFFLPWVSIECRGERMATQTGVQMLIGSATATQRSKDKQVKFADEGESLGHSYLGAIALVAVAGALLMSFAALIAGRRDLDHGCGVLCAVALVCLLLQLSFGFPAERAIREDILKPPSSEGVTMNIDLGEMGQTLQKEVLAGIRVAPLPWFYWELAALALPTLVLGNALLDRIKAKES
jgi:hypothetical protein